MTTGHHNFISVLLITASLCLTALPVTAELLSYQENYGPKEKKRYNPAQYTLSKKTPNSLLNFQCKLSKKHSWQNADEMLVDLNLGYGRLFSPVNNGYLGFGYLSAKIDTENRLRFYGSLGYSVPSIKGEFLATYRLLASQLNSTSSSLAAIDERIYENSLSLSFTRYTETFLRETSLLYEYSGVPGKIYGEDSSEMFGGFGDTTSHEIAAKMAFGLEELDFGFIRGFKTSLSLGYQHVVHDQLYDYAEQIDKSLTALTTLEQKTAIGIFSASYDYAEASQTMSVGYSIKGLNFYAKETRYPNSEPRQMVGFSIKFDLWNARDPFQKKKKLFGSAAKAAYSNRKHEQIRHNSNFGSDSFTTLPLFRDL